MTRVQGTSAAIETKFLSKPIRRPRPARLVPRRTSCAGHLRLEGRPKRYARTCARRWYAFSSLLRKHTQDATRRVYAFVPDMPLDRMWTDPDLYARYGLSEGEIAFIEAM